MVLRTSACYSSSTTAVAASSSSKTAPRGTLSSLFIDPLALTTSNPKSTTKGPITNLPNQTPLEKFLKSNCKSGTINLNDAKYFFNHMITMQPIPPISSFNVLLGAVAKIRHCFDVISMYTRMSSIGLSPDFITLNILLNCFCNLNRAVLGFAVFGGILKRGYSPNAVTFTSLVKGLCMEEKIIEATGLFKKMVKLGCQPNVITYGTLINGLCRTGNTGLALRLHEEMVNGNGKWEEAKGLFNEMVDQGVRPNVVTFNVLIDALCKEGKTKEANGLLELMIQRGQDLQRRHQLQYSQ